jgi:aspartokinase
MKPDTIDIIKNKFSKLFFANSDAETKIEVSDRYLNSVISFLEEISNKSKTIKVTMIKESDYGLSFYTNEYSEEILETILKHEKNNLKQCVKG